MFGAPTWREWGRALCFKHRIDTLLIDGRVFAIDHCTDQIHEFLKRFRSVGAFKPNPVDVSFVNRRSNTFQPFWDQGIDQIDKGLELITVFRR